MGWYRSVDPAERPRGIVRGSTAVCRVERRSDGEPTPIAKSMVLMVRPLCFVTEDRSAHGPKMSKTALN